MQLKSDQARRGCSSSEDPTVSISDKTDSQEHNTIMLQLPSECKLKIVMHMCRHNARDRATFATLFLLCKDMNALFTANYAEIVAHYTINLSWGDIKYSRLCGYMHSISDRDDQPGAIFFKGTDEWYDADVFQIEAGLPSRLYGGGTRCWFKRGKLHRGDDMPAVMHADGSQIWCQNGLLHRDGDLPAVIMMSTWDDISFISRQMWYQHGRLHRDNDLPAEIFKCVNGDGHQKWYRDGKLHRVAAPAYITTCGEERWYTDGECTSHTAAPIQRCSTLITGIPSCNILRLRLLPPVQISAAIDEAAQCYPPDIVFKVYVNQETIDIHTQGSTHWMYLAVSCEKSVNAAVRWGGITSYIFVAEDTVKLHLALVGGQYDILDLLAPCSLFAQAFRDADRLTKEALAREPQPPQPAPQSHHPLIQHAPQHEAQI
jgi:hypothetical protein